MAPGLRFHVRETNVGWVGLVVSERGLRYTTPPQRSRDAALMRAVELGGAEPVGDGEVARLADGVAGIAEGRRVDLTSRIDWNGIAGFRREVMEETLRIPAGETRTYGWLAAKVGRPRAARAVGRVMATNPLPLVVPCHRVVGADGSLRGYGEAGRDRSSAGLAVKAALLRAEGAR
jgi:methylated-DNA-[protein]-cysteine S-methyltransferase